MKNIQIEPKVSLLIVLVVVAIISIVIYKNIDSFNNLIKQIDVSNSQYEKILH